jgi:hypothetical protein
MKWALAHLAFTVEPSVGICEGITKSSTRLAAFAYRTSGESPIKNCASVA